MPEERSTANAIFSELVKSYGVKVEEDWSMNWSVENIGEAFKESPVWTTIDYLTLGVPFGKMASAAWKVQRGVGAAGRAFRGVNLAGEAVEGATKLTRGQAYRATMKNAVPRTVAGRVLSNPITQRYDDEYLQLMDKFGMDPAEARGLYDQFKVDAKLDLDANRKLVGEAISSQRKLGLGDRESITRNLTEAVTPADLVDATPNMQKAYAKTYQLRNHIHNESMQNGMIPYETWVKNLETYMPRLYKQYQDDGTLSQFAKLYGEGKLGKQGVLRFKGAAPEDLQGLDRIWDASLTTEQLGKAVDTIARQKFARRIANSAIVKTPEEIVAGLESFGRIKDADFARAALKPGTMQKLAKLKERGGVTTSELEDVFRYEGWSRVDDLVETGVTGWDNLPEELMGKWVDPAAAHDVGQMFNFMEQAPTTNFLLRAMQKVHRAGIGTFRASKTAYNPATHVRNFVGNIVFHSMATGSPKLAPVRGMKAMHEAWKTGATDDMFEAIQAGVIGSSFDVEIREAMVATMREIDWTMAAKLDVQEVTALDWMGTSKLAKLMQGGAAKAEKVYRLTDEVWKLDAFLDNRDKFVRSLAKERGLDPAKVLRSKKVALTPGLDDATRALKTTYDDAIGEAQLAVQKFMPQFSTHSPLGDAVRGVVPFASFTTEALRIWRNALVERPVQAFAWAHMAETASYGIGAMMGMDMDEVDRTKEFLPEHQRQKQNMLLPFKIDGKANYLDLSYVIPLASIGEAAEVENIFFGGLFNPSSNPLLNFVAAASTGVDPFTERTIEPRFTEKVLGRTLTDSPDMRRAFGMIEHMAVTMVPPIMPPGYAAQNLIELARGDVNPRTGQPYEPNYGRTLFANLAGMRSYEASVSAQLQNAMKEQLEVGKRIQVWRKQYAMGAANGDPAAMNSAISEIRSLRLGQGDTPKEVNKYVRRMSETLEPGKYRNVSSRQLEDVLQRSAQLPRPLSREDRLALSELTKRRYEKKKRRKRGE